MNRGKETALTWDMARAKWLTAIEIYQDLSQVANIDTLDRLQSRIDALNAAREAAYEAHADEMKGDNRV